jgi:hypothetical protein
VVGLGHEPHHLNEDVVMTQKFLISVQAMCTSDEADLVSKWSAVVAQEDLGNISLVDASIVSMAPLIKDCPIEFRPMTDEEIRAWRKEEQS